MAVRYGTLALRDLFQLFTHPRKGDRMRELQVDEPESVKVLLKIHGPYFVHNVSS
jgi:hypothetical protein